MDKSFWLDRWQRRDIGFHQPHIHDQLQRFWPRLEVESGGTVFVPLSGKSRDMAWLAGEGARVVGVELSEDAVAEFFAESGLDPARHRRGAIDVWSAGPCTLLCGDIFDVTPDDVGPVSAGYDRAALVAFPAEMRPRYAETLARLMPPGSPLLLISLEYPQGEISGPPFSVDGEEIACLFGDRFDISLLESRDGLAASANLKKRGVTRLEETAYLLRRRA